MKKLLSLSLASLMLVLALCSCSCSVRVGDKTYSSDNNDSSAAESAEETPENTQNLLFTWKIKIDGVDYTVPFDYSEIAANGFTFDTSKDAELGKRTYTVFSSTLKKDDKSFSVKYWNPSDTPKMLSQCQIGDVSFYASNPIEVVLPGGLVFDESVTVQDIIDKYGEPDTMNEKEDYTSIYYRQDTYSTVNFMSYTKEEAKFKYNEVSIQNLV